MASGSGESHKKKILWSDRMTRVMLDLYILEKNDGHTKGGNLSEAGKENMTREFNKILGMNLTYGKIKNRIDTLKKDYYIYKKITHGATGLGFDPVNGTLQAPDHWWKSKIQVYPEAEKIRTNPLKFIPLLDVVCGDVTIVVEKSWQPRRGLDYHAPPIPMCENEEGSEENEMPATIQDSTNGLADIHEAQSMSELPNSSNRSDNAEAPTRPSGGANLNAGQKKKRKRIPMETA
ncbi:PREDICTED: uncharacterized protein At2g29880-like, partial [Tarenaya hassleriana]|uniref:uncharacterized protein At2g29880-like n=1 Tax=Tarenaya hassleriana TaxID=28532 RepID=UPI00053C1B27